MHPQHAITHTSTRRPHATVCQSTLPQAGPLQYTCMHITHYTHSHTHTHTHTHTHRTAQVREPQLQGLRSLKLDHCNLEASTSLAPLSQFPALTSLCFCSGCCGQRALQGLQVCVCEGVCVRVRACPCSSCCRQSLLQSLLVCVRVRVCVFS